MNPAGELLRPEDIELDVDASDRERLLGRAADLLARRIGMTGRQVLDRLRAREQLGSTALGHGVAFPHARMPGCRNAAAAFVRTRTPIEFNAPDRAPVSQFLALIVPRQANEHHLQILATAAAMFSDPGFRRKLDACRDARCVADAVAAWSDSGPEGL
jgi:PTS system nitrogen regulatory IIA component